MTPDANQVPSPVDSKRGRSPDIRLDGTGLIYEFGVLGGEMHTPPGWFVPTPRTRLVINCDLQGEITLRIREGKSAC